MVNCPTPVTVHYGRTAAEPSRQEGRQNHLWTKAKEGKGILHLTFHTPYPNQTQSQTQTQMQNPRLDAKWNITRPPVRLIHSLTHTGLIWDRCLFRWLRAPFYPPGVIRRDSIGDETCKTGDRCDGCRRASGEGSPLSRS